MIVMAYQLSSDVRHFGEKYFGHILSNSRVKNEKVLEENIWSSISFGFHNGFVGDSDYKLDGLGLSVLAGYCQKNPAAKKIVRALIDAFRKAPDPCALNNTAINEFEKSGLVNALSAA